MLGKFDNVMRALHIFPACVRSQLHIKAFPYREIHPEKPYKHAHFNVPDTGFWRKDFWTSPPDSAQPMRGTPGPGGSDRRESGAA